MSTYLAGLSFDQLEMSVREEQHIAQPWTVIPS